MLPDVPFSDEEGFYLVPFSGAESSEDVLLEEGWVYLRSQDDLKIPAYAYPSVSYRWLESTDRSPLSAGLSTNTRPLPPIKVEEGTWSGFNTKSGLPEIGKPVAEKYNDKDKVEVPLDEQIPGFKRPRITVPLQSQDVASLRSSAANSWSFETHNEPIISASSEAQSAEVRSGDSMPRPMPPPHITGFNPFNEPSPLGLTLRKTPSLVDLIQMKLAQGELTLPPKSKALVQEIANKAKRSAAALNSQQDKLKASNFPASMLKIGSWECISRYEGDVVAKCYYAKRKLVWEVLHGELKSKIEIQWSDITGLRAICPDNEQGVLDIEISRPPLFFRETNPQPRKHTLWQATSDFTGGQATICRQHYLQFPPGLLNRHYEKLMQCDPRLKSLSDKCVTSNGPTYFERQNKTTNEQQGWHQHQLHQQAETHSVLNLELQSNKCLPPLSNLQIEPTVTAEMKSLAHVPKLEPIELEDGMKALVSKAPPSSISDMTGSNQAGYMRHTVSNNKPRVQRIPPNMLLSECMDGGGMSCSGSCASGDTQSSNRKILDEISYHLLGEPLVPAALDDQLTSSRLNKMSSFRQMDFQLWSALPASSVSAESVPLSSV